MSTGNTNIFEGGLNDRSKAYLLETTRWTKFLGIIGILIIALMLFIIAVMMFANASDIFRLDSSMGYYAIGMTVAYTIITIISFFPIISLLKFSSAMKNGISTNNEDLITEGFRHQKNLFKAAGIITILTIILYILLFLVAGITSLNYLGK